MTAMIDQIIENLEQSQSLYSALLPMLEREKRAAMQPNSRQLSAVIVEKEELMVRLSSLERQRIHLVQGMAEDMNLLPAQLNLSELANLTDTRRAARILSLKASLGRLMMTIKRANAENRMLFQHCLDLARGALGFFQHWMTSASVYSSTGRIDNGHRNGKLLSGLV